MLNIEKLQLIEKDDLPEASGALDSTDIKLLVKLLSEKDDIIRYHSLLLLQHRSENFNDVHPYWEVFCEKLKSANSYQRSIGMMLISANVKWDSANRIDHVIDDFLSLLQDEKPITVRQCIQSLSGILQYKSHLNKKIADKLMSLDINNIKATMQKLILIDILTILALIRRQQANCEIDSYILNSLSGGMLDKKAIKQIQAMLG